MKIIIIKVNYNDHTAIQHFFKIILYMLLYTGIRGWESRIGYDYCVCDGRGGGLDKFVGSLWDIYICMCST